MKQILRFGRLLVQVLSTGHLQLTRISGQKRGQKVEKTSNSQNRALARKHNYNGEDTLFSNVCDMNARRSFIDPIRILT